jgi:probable rRNA maturation factor
VSLEVDIQVASTDPAPPEAALERWVAAALAERTDEAEISVRLVSENEMTALNRRYRNRDGSTNVLSFPAALPEGVDHPLLGDIVICPAVVNREAAEQHKTPEQHWSHMLVHGCLHLLGYDHVDPAAAADMEALETGILERLGYPCPYEAPPAAGAGA